jgi:DNA polymerase III subunit beta
MKLKLEKKALLEGLQIVQSIVSSRSTLPILSNVLLSAEGEKLWFTTTDLEVTVKCRVGAEVIKDGATTVPVRRFAGIIRELPDQPIDLEIDDGDVAVITCGSSYFKIIGMSSDDFPTVPTAVGQRTYHLDQGVFREMLRKTAYAASTDETRYVLNGVLLSFRDGKLTMVATDGRRLALVENEVEIAEDAEADMILPSKAVNELSHALQDAGDLKISVQDNQIVFEFSEVLVASKLIDGTYPNFRQVIPSQCDERVSVERELLLMALRRVSLIAADKSSATRFSFGNNQLEITANTPDIGEARETLPIKYTGKEITVAFNPEYVMDPLKNLSNDEIAFEMTDELSPGLIKCDIPFLYVLMPMRVD